MKQIKNLFLCCLVLALSIQAKTQQYSSVKIFPTGSKTFGPYSLPFGRPSFHPGSDSLTVQQQQYYTFLRAAMGKYKGMRAGNSIQSVGYEVAGGVKDWMLKSGGSLPPLPLTYINLAGKLRTDHLVELKWQAETDQAQNRFIIEKSANGISYSEIGINENRNIYIDHFPVPGNNYYRIRSEMTNGESIYSQVVNVIWKPESNITIYPNPVFDELNIRINNPLLGVSKVMVTDLRGQVLFTKSSENGIKSDLKIQTGDWVPQIYTVTLLNEKNEILEVKKFLRQ